ncbi:hypothetical protein KBD69_00135 [Candidatus Woesebacteria bacterium]|nr:hypothetical protein [Candidatus Woesebacteria bacterium]
MKYRFLILLTVITLTTSPVVVSAADDTTKRRPDRAEFVTESHVRLTTESLTIAEVTEATPTSPANQGLLMMLKESWLDFVESIRNLF